MPDFPCHICHTLLQADEGQAGQLVRCPTCQTTLRVPADAAPLARALSGPRASMRSDLSAPAPLENRPAAPSRAHGQSGRSTAKRYGFNCGYCSSRLEATEASAGQDGQCPTCGSTITIPILDRYGRLIDPKTREIIKQNPHPVHAYAAAGERAPRILRSTDGEQLILCARCGAANPIVANNCKACGMPFTMEGTTLEASGASNGYAVASMVLGIIGIPASCSILPSLLAIILGGVGYSQITRSGVEGMSGGGKGMAIAGMVLGAIGLMIAMWVHLG